MVNFHDPAVIAQDLFAVKKFWHALTGLYIWEFVTTLDYEWSVIRGRRPYRWTMMIYSVTRVSTLIATILIVVAFNVTAKYNCQAEIAFQLIFGYLASSAASLLIVLRIIAIWNRNKLVKAIATSVWVTNLGFLIHHVVQIRTAWMPAAAGCMVDNILSVRLNTITTFITDITLLLLMLVGLLRLGFHESGVFGLGHLMWRQGLIWFFLATIVYVPPLVFISLNLNVPLSYMFYHPTVITISIVATRIHRSLADSSSKTTDIVIISDRVHPIDLMTSKTNRDPAQPVLLEPIEVAGHKTYEQYQTSQTGPHSSSINWEGSQHNKPAGLELDFDAERGVPSRTLTHTSN